jgi:hypothetical protein
MLAPAVRPTASEAISFARASIEVSRLRMTEGAQASADAVRAAKNELVLRDLNERLKAYPASLNQLFSEWVCECADVTCMRPVELSIEEYEMVRAEPTWNSSRSSVYGTAGPLAVIRSRGSHMCAHHTTTSRRRRRRAGCYSSCARKRPSRSTIKMLSASHSAAAAPRYETISMREPARLRGGVLRYTTASTRR